MMEKIIVLNEDCAEGFEERPRINYFLVNEKQKIMEEWQKCGYTEEEAFKLVDNNCIPYQ